VRVKIDLSQIESEPLRFDERLTLEAEHLDPDQVAEEFSVQLEGTVRSIGPGFSVEGSFEATGKVSCGRCLELVPWQAQERFAVEYRRRDAHPDEDEVALDDGDLDVSFLTDNKLDLNRMAAEQVLLALPMRVLCAEECAGLCPKCGANLNIAGACRCEPETDPRWDALRDVAGGDAAN
jgi:uncharacterized protein